MPGWARISAREEKGIDQLEEVLKDLFFQGEISFNDQVCITNLRQKQLLEESLAALDRVEESLQMGMPEDFYSIDLMDAYEKLGRITGEAVDDDLADEIFAKFCMGK